MIWKRIELHNHSLESDGCLTVPELVTYLCQRGIRNFSLTDHNTISGWCFLPAACAMQPENMEYLQGLELTTYYGHMLCQNISSYIPWDDLDETDADKLLQRAHEAGGLAGPAHPFSIPAPFSNGMRWTMRVRDPHLLDFIELINRAHPFYPDNAAAIDWWRSLVLEGCRIAPVSGLDLHGPFEGPVSYTTYLGLWPKEERLPLSAQFDRAIRACRSCVTAGPILDWQESSSGFEVFLLETPAALNPGAEASPFQPKNMVCQLSVQGKQLVKMLEGGRAFFPFSELPAGVHAAVFLLYEIADTAKRSGTEILSAKNVQRLIAAARPWFDRQTS